MVALGALRRGGMVTESSGVRQVRQPPPKAARGCRCLALRRWVTPSCWRGRTKVDENVICSKRLNHCTVIVTLFPREQLSARTH